MFFCILVFFAVSKSVKFIPKGLSFKTVFFLSLLYFFTLRPEMIIFSDDGISE